MFGKLWQFYDNLSYDKSYDNFGELWQNENFKPIVILKHSNLLKIWTNESEPYRIYIRFCQEINVWSNNLIVMYDYVRYKCKLYLLEKIEE